MSQYIQGEEREIYSKSHFNRPENFINRELSWLEFNTRVLWEARDKQVKLFERMKFLSITASNLDEFFMVRVASLYDQVHANFTKVDIAGMTAKKQLDAISRKTHQFVKEQYSTYNRSIVPNLKKVGLHLIRKYEELNKKEAAFVDTYFMEHVYPVLTPMAVDASRPFPLIHNKRLNIAAILQRKDTQGVLLTRHGYGKGKKKKREVEQNQSYVGEGLDFALVQVPSVLDRVVKIPNEYTEDPESTTIILLEEIIEKNIYRLFLNYDIVCAHYFRIMRNAEFELDEEDAADLLEEIQKKLKKRQRGEAIRLEVEDGIDERLLKVLKKVLDIGEQDLFEIKGPIDLTFLMKLYGIPGFEEYKDIPYIPASVPELKGAEDIYQKIREGDILLSHPYQSFTPVVQFIENSAYDPDVLAIKQTLYRVSGNSPIIAALEKAAENGKQVTVLVELKARFDEENNINWAKKLEKAGCHVIYGLVGLKTHSKITLVVRKEADGIRRYVHLGTGNYNDTTAKLYTDLGMFTCRPEYGEDATAVFNMLSGFSNPLLWNRLIVAPVWMKERFLEIIKQARLAAYEGKEVRIIAKMNSLSDKDIIIALYKAAAAGVEIDLIVRGICCLKVGLKECNNRIRVRSIVGSFLEHSRVFYFSIDGKEEYYLGSADWMNRNLDKRVEIVFPVVDKRLQKKIKHYLEVQLQDNVKASIYQKDGSYIKMDLRGKVKINSQEVLMEEAHEKQILD